MRVQQQDKYGEKVGVRGIGVEYATITQGWEKQSHDLQVELRSQNVVSGIARNIQLEEWTWEGESGGSCSSTVCFRRGLGQ